MQWVLGHWSCVRATLEIWECTGGAVDMLYWPGECPRGTLEGLQWILDANWFNGVMLEQNRGSSGEAILATWMNFCLLD
jgi:hypothetical protein